jgi:hypothetical protein
VLDQVLDIKRRILAFIVRPVTKVPEDSLLQRQCLLQRQIWPSISGSHLEIYSKSSQKNDKKILQPAPGMLGCFGFCKWRPKGNTECPVFSGEVASSSWIQSWRELVVLHWPVAGPQGRCDYDTFPPAR